MKFIGNSHQRSARRRRPFLSFGGQKLLMDLFEEVTCKKVFSIGSCNKSVFWYFYGWPPTTSALTKKRHRKFCCHIMIENLFKRSPNEKSGCALVRSLTHFYQIIDEYPGLNLLEYPCWFSSNLRIPAKSRSMSKSFKSVQNPSSFSAGKSEKRKKQD